MRLRISRAVWFPPKAWINVTGDCSFPSEDSPAPSCKIHKWRPPTPSGSTPAVTTNLAVVIFTLEVSKCNYGYVSEKHAGIKEHAEERHLVRSKLNARAGSLTIARVEVKREDRALSMPMNLRCRHTNRSTVHIPRGLHARRAGNGWHRRWHRCCYRSHVEGAFASHLAECFPPSLFWSVRFLSKPVFITMVFDRICREISYKQPSEAASLFPGLALARDRRIFTALSHSFTNT